jgi:hypothetical protein
MCAHFVPRSAELPVFVGAAEVGFSFQGFDVPRRVERSTAALRCLAEFPARTQDPLATAPQLQRTAAALAAAELQLASSSPRQGEPMRFSILEGAPIFIDKRDSGGLRCLIYTVAGLPKLVPCRPQRPAPRPQQLVLTPVTVRLLSGKLAARIASEKH